MANQDVASLSHAVERDLRLDLFRGIGLWMIFLDHIPDDFVAWLTLRNYGFSDAAEFFVFISGYLAGYIYGPIIGAGNFLAALKRLWTRVWQMYVAHIMLFLLFTAQIARTVRKFDNPLYEDEFNVHNFLLHPDVLIGQALTLRYKPVNLDVLPLFITLVAAAPLVLWAMVRRPNLTLLGSVILYVLARMFDWNFASYPPGTTWYFNPFAWQLMFVFGAWCGVGGIARGGGVVIDPPRPAGLEHQRVQVPPSEAQPEADRNNPGGTGPVPDTDDHGRAVRIVPAHDRGIRAQQPAGLLGDRAENLLRRRRPGHQRGHPAQRRLLLGEPAQLHARLRVGDRGRDQLGEPG